jgi:hypothetical protein
LRLLAEGVHIFLASFPAVVQPLPVRGLSVVVAPSISYSKYEIFHQSGFLPSGRVYKSFVFLELNFAWCVVCQECRVALPLVAIIDIFSIVTLLDHSTYGGRC